MFGDCGFVFCVCLVVLSLENVQNSVSNTCPIEWVTDPSDVQKTYVPSYRITHFNPPHALVDFGTFCCNSQLQFGDFVIS